MLLSLLISVILTVSVPPAGAPSYWDKVLDCYEQLCDACVSNKDSKTIATIKGELDALLKNPVGKMNGSQQKRFEDIRRHYKDVKLGDPESSRTDTIVIVKQVPQEKIREVEKVREIEHVVVYDTVKVENSINTIVIEHQYSRKDTTIVIHTLKPAYDTAAKPSLSWFAGVTAGFAPNFSIGIFAGIGNKAGGYIKARSNFKSVTAQYSIDNLEKGGFWGNGNSETTRRVICAGGWLTLYKGLRLYAGAGYGESAFYIQDTSNSWVEVSGSTYRSVALDLGLMYRFKYVMLFCGANTTAFKYTDAEAGVAIAF